MLTNATQIKLGESGKRDASPFLKQIITTHKCATKYKKAFNPTKQQTSDFQLTPVQALSMFVEADLSRRQYEVLTKRCILQKTKQEFYPNKQSYRVTETLAEINVQSFIDHTATLEEMHFYLSVKKEAHCF